MKKIRAAELAATLLNILIVSACANCFAPLAYFGALWAIPAAGVFLLINIFPAETRRPLLTAPLRVCRHGLSCLRAFAGAVVLSLAWQIYFAVLWIPERWQMALWSLLICVFALAVVFWNGMICAYCSSVQLGVRRRAVGILCGFIPVVNLVVLAHIMRTISREIDFEGNKLELDASRAGRQLCRTKYPLLLVHGVFFRDFKFPNYWGRIPDELIRNGARVYYGCHQSAASVAR